ncbi:MAG: sulfatase-like hydrolase/transferase [Planctomycetota bacterium]
MKKTVMLFVLVSCFFASHITLAESPNFIVILSDDQSWVGSSVEMIPGRENTKSDYFETPNLERFAAAGMQFSRGYSPAPYCCPTRRAFCIGQTPARHVYQKDQPGWARRYREQLSIPRMLKMANSNYVTAHFGKWDSRFDGVSPEEMGYDLSDGKTGNETGGAKGTGGPAAVVDPKLIYSMTDRATEFMKQQVEADKPFYLQLSHYAVHLDIFYSDETYAAAQSREIGKKHSLPEFAAMTSDLDAGIGKLMKAVDALNLRDDTYVFYFSDNGGRLTMPGQKESTKDPRNAPLFGGKGSMYEGGIRVPFFAIGPGIEPGSHCDVPVTGLDLFPTMADLAGLEQRLPESLDGGSLKELLLNQGHGAVERAKPYLIFHQAVARKAQSAIIQGDYKLVKTWAADETELFDLSKSLTEKSDLSETKPKIATKMHKQLVEFLDEVGAETRKTTDKERQRKLFETLDGSN